MGAWRAALTGSLARAQQPKLAWLTLAALFLYCEVRLRIGPAASHVCITASN